jgi:hypothetical protein
MFRDFYSELFCQARRFLQVIPEGVWPKKATQDGEKGRVKGRKILPGQLPSIVKSPPL